MIIETVPSTKTNLLSTPQRGSNRTNNIDGVEVGSGCPTMQYSKQDASRNNSVVM